MLAIIGLILIALWLLGVVLHIAGGLIHFVLVLAAILIVLHFLTGTKPAAQGDDARLPVMKTLIVEIEDGTKAELMEKVEVRHLGDIANEVRDALENFVKQNEGALIPPVSIRVEEKECSDKDRPRR